MKLVNNMFPDNIKDDLLERRHYISNRLVYLKYKIENVSTNDETIELYNELTIELNLIDKILANIKA
jgi:hypothetical protein